MNRIWACAAILAGSLLAIPAHSTCLESEDLTGVNLAGAEFNSKRLPGTMHKDYTYPTQDELAYFAGKGATVIRLPFRWERVQRTAMGPLDPAEVGAMAKVVNQATLLGLCVILDAHNYGSYFGQAVGTGEVPAEALIDLWVKLAQRFPDESRVALGLMNEPSKILLVQWVPLAQYLVSALRTAGVRNVLFVSGGRWSGVHEWHKEFSGLSNAAGLAGLTDPLNRTVIEVHQYADADFSGTGTNCHPPERFDNMFQLITDWARANNQKLFLGEFGVPANETCMAVLDRMLSLVADRSVWRGWAYWAAGRWWGTYPLSVAPRSGSDAPQMTVLERYLGT